MISGTSNLLMELLDGVGEPFEWLDDERAIFELDDVTYGIFVEYLTTPTEPALLVGNIAFGRVHGEFNSAANLDLTVTSANKPLRVFSTVASACVANKKLTSADALCAGASDNKLEKRASIYGIMMSKIANLAGMPFKHAFTLKTPNGPIINVRARLELSQDQQVSIAEVLHLSKP